ncbi:MAG: PilZ domain-containing protein [Pseudomonadota bacterium]
MEKRRHKRLDLQIPVTVRCNGKLLPATATNVSVGGMCIKTEAFDDVKKDDLVEVYFDLDEKRRDLSLRGAIARVNGSADHNIGVQFGNFHSESHKILRQFLHRELHSSLFQSLERR